MENLSAGIIALILFSDASWVRSKAYNVAFNCLEKKSPKTARELQLTLVEQENIGKAVSFEAVKDTASQSLELKEALEALGQEIKANTDRELEIAFHQLASLTNVQENHQGINIKGGTNIVENINFNFGK